MGNDLVWDLTIVQPEQYGLLEKNTIMLHFRARRFARHCQLLGRGNPEHPIMLTEDHAQLSKQSMVPMTHPRSDCRVGNGTGPWPMGWVQTSGLQVV